MEETSTEVFYTLFYILFSACIVYPPIEFISAGITIPMLFSHFLGSETELFVQYQIRRSCLTLLVYSLLPIGYLFGLWFFGYRELHFLWNMEASYIGYVITTVVLLLPITAACQINYWHRDKWKYHPISINISKFCNNNSDWLSVASDINKEYRRIDKIRIQSNAVCKIVVTENWIIKVTPLYMHIAHQSDATLEVNHSDTHHISPDNPGVVQYINIEVMSSRNGIKSFIIRLNTNEFKNFQDRIAHTITVLPNVSFHKSVLEKFIDAFKAVIMDNPHYSVQEVLDNCIGCMQAVANIKLQKACNSNGVETDECVTCYCRPMWCVDCMAKWFALKQDQEHPETWLSSKCTCPLCRAKFCLLDVCLIDKEQC